MLVTVKATPQPSERYGDTSCVAGIRIDGDEPSWIRLYPIAFRWLDGDAQFKKYDVITVSTRPAGADLRPESRKIDAEGISVISHVRDWRSRSTWIEPLVGPSMCELISGTQADVNAQSLAALRPRRVKDIEFSRHEGWSARQLEQFDAYKNQGDLFRETPARVLEAPRWIVHLRYECESENCHGHSQRIIDWELTALQARFRNRSDADLMTAVRRNFFEIPFAADRAPLILVGNQESITRRSSFTVLGIYYPRRSDVQQAERLF